MRINITVKTAYPLVIAVEALRESTVPEAIADVFFALGCRDIEVVIEEER